MTVKIIFMGTPAFALPALQALIQAGYQIQAVYSQPPKPSGRGLAVQKSSIHNFSEQHGIPVFTPKSLRSLEEQEKFRSLNADLAVVAAYGLILPKAILDAPKYGCLNIHGSLLPRWRGAAPMQRALLAGDSKTGITVMKMDEGLDTGPMLTTCEVPITPTTTIAELHDHMAQEGARLLIETIPGYINGDIQPVLQPTEGITYADKLIRTDGIIDWRNPAIIIDRQVRALTPWPGVSFFDGTHHLKVLKACVVNQSGKPGEIVDSNLTIACGEQAIQVLVVQKPGSKPLDVHAFLNGYPLKAGTILPCPDTN